MRGVCEGILSDPISIELVNLASPHSGTVDIYLLSTDSPLALLVGPTLLRHRPSALDTRKEEQNTDTIPTLRVAFAVAVKIYDSAIALFF